MKSLKQGAIAEWLDQAFDGTLFEKAWTDSFSLSGDEDDRNRLPAARQFPLEIRSGYAWGHGDIEDKTFGLVDVVGRKERLRGGKRPSRIPELPHQVGQRLAHRFIVIDHGYKWTQHHHRLFTPQSREHARLDGASQLHFGIGLTLAALAFIFSELIRDLRHEDAPLQRELSLIPHIRQ